MTADVIWGKNETVKRKRGENIREKGRKGKERRKGKDKEKIRS
jgi:hypothetical protein